MDQNSFFVYVVIQVIKHSYSLIDTVLKAQTVIKRQQIMILIPNENDKK